MNSFIFRLSLPNVRLLDKPQKYICKYIKINNWSDTQIIFHRRPTSQGVLNNDPMIWIGGARPSQKVLLNNFKLKLNISFASTKNSCPPKKMAKSLTAQVSLPIFFTKSVFNELTSMEENIFFIECIQ